MAGRTRAPQRRPRTQSTPPVAAARSSRGTCPCGRCVVTAHRAAVEQVAVAGVSGQLGQRMAAAVAAPGLNRARRGCCRRSAGCSLAPRTTAAATTQTQHACAARAFLSAWTCPPTAYLEHSTHARAAQSCFARPRRHAGRRRPAHKCGRERAGGAPPVAAHRLDVAVCELAAPCHARDHDNRQRVTAACSRGGHSRRAAARHAGRRTNSNNPSDNAGQGSCSASGLNRIAIRTTSSASITLLLAFGGLTFLI
eukprot:352993-Chlamydomonas_euryale.AAC.2